MTFTVIAIEDGFEFYEETFETPDEADEAANQIAWERGGLKGYDGLVIKIIENGDGN